METCCIKYKNRQRLCKGLKKPVFVLIVDNIYEYSQIVNSRMMYSYWLEKSFKLFNNIELVVFNRSLGFNNYPVSDYTVIHTLAGSINQDQFRIIRDRTRKKIAVFVEVKIPDYGMTDLFFTYGQYNGYKRISINAPIDKSEYIYKEKIPNSILLDHAWIDYYGTVNERYELTLPIINMLEKHKDNFKIYKLMKWNEKPESYPDWITQISQVSFKNYLEAISDKAVFIATHYGSYNSSVVDAVAFGAKVIIPRVGRPFAPWMGRPFVPKYNVKLFDLIVANSVSHIERLIYDPMDPVKFKNNIDKCTDMIDACRFMLEKMGIYE